MSKKGRPREVAMSFVVELVSQILEGAKTETRRPAITAIDVRAGDVLWVRERARVIAIDSVADAARLRFEADGFETYVGIPDRLAPLEIGKCVPNGVFREGARLFLPITEAGEERLLDLTEAGAIAEGIERFAGGWRGIEGSKPKAFPTAREAYFSLWDALYARTPRGKRLLESSKNPRVRVYRWKEARSTSPIRRAA